MKHVFLPLRSDLRNSPYFLIWQNKIFAVACTATEADELKEQYPYTRIATSLRNRAGMWAVHAASPKKWDLVASEYMQVATPAQIGEFLGEMARGATAAAKNTTNPRTGKPYTVALLHGVAQKLRNGSEVTPGMTRIIRAVINASVFALLLWFAPANAQVGSGEYTIISTCYDGPQIIATDTMAATVGPWRKASDGIFAVVLLPHGEKTVLHQRLDGSYQIWGIEMNFVPACGCFRYLGIGVWQQVTFIPKKK